MPIFAFIVIFALWSMYEIRKSSANQQKRTDQFWEEERLADSVRRQDISHLDYILIPYEELPFDDSAEEPIRKYQNQILELKDQNILNLTGYTNTELKQMYGAPNLEQLSEYDTNFTKLVSAIARWAQALYDNGELVPAKTLLEYGIRIHTDVSSNYITLGKIYLSEDNIEAIYELIEKAQDLKSLMKDSIINHLREILSSDENPQD